MRVLFYNKINVIIKQMYFVLFYFIEQNENYPHFATWKDRDETVEKKKCKSLA